MMSDIKDKRKKNDENKLSKHFENAEIVFRQESDIIFEKTIQFKIKNDNKKTFNYKFSEDDAVNYIAPIKKNEHEVKI